MEKMELRVLCGTITVARRYKRRDGSGSSPYFCAQLNNNTNTNTTQQSNMVFQNAPRSIVLAGAATAALTAYSLFQLRTKAKENYSALNTQHFNAQHLHK
jgi:hypothetical protein